MKLALTFGMPLVCFTFYSSSIICFDIICSVMIFLIFGYSSIGMMFSSSVCAGTLEYAMPFKSQNYQKIKKNIFFNFMQFSNFFYFLQFLGRDQYFLVQWMARHLEPAFFPEKHRKLKNYMKKGQIEKFQEIIMFLIFWTRKHQSRLKNFKK